MCMLERVPVKPKMTSSSIHHWQRGRALPSAVQPLLQASEEGGREGGGRGGGDGEGARKQEANRHTQMHSGQTETACQKAAVCCHIRADTCFCPVSFCFSFFLISGSRQFVSATILRTGEFIKSIQSERFSADQLFNR